MPRWLDRFLAWAAPSTPPGVPDQREPADDLDDSLSVFGPRQKWGPNKDTSTRLIEALRDDPIWATHFYMLTQLTPHEQARLVLFKRGVEESIDVAEVLDLMDALSRRSDA